jgi:cytochrome c oxidase cbb3-type subunit 1
MTIRQSKLEAAQGKEDADIPLFARDAVQAGE